MASDSKVDLAFVRNKDKRFDFCKPNFRNKIEVEEVDKIRVGKKTARAIAKKMYFRIKDNKRVRSHIISQRVGAMQYVAQYPTTSV